MARVGALDRSDCRRWRNNAHQMIVGNLKQLLCRLNVHHACLGCIDSCKTAAESISQRRRIFSWTADERITAVAEATFNTIGKKTYKTYNRAFLISL